MQDLRLIGVHEDGRHLLLADESGGRYRLPLDAPLRAAARRDVPRMGQLQIEMEGGLRPREVQALVRRGLSTEEVAERAGWSVEKVMRYEGPILAEREYVANLAQRLVLPGRGASHTTLRERVVARLEARGVERELAQWDSARHDDGYWVVSLFFPAGGRQRTATWRFDPGMSMVSATNDEARWLSEDEAAGPIPAPHHPGAGAEEVFDVEAPPRPRRQRRASAPPPSFEEPAVEPSQEHPEPVDLMAAIREHSNRGPRGRRRRGTTSPAAPSAVPPAEDALPIEPLTADPTTVPPPPAARDEHPTEAHLDEDAIAAQRARETGDEHDEDAVPGASDGGSADEPDERGRGSAETVDAKAELEGAALREPEESTARPTGAAPQEGVPPLAAESAARPERSRRGRPSVPSWDDIVFGSRSGGDQD